jgi:hypothetical protein
MKRQALPAPQAPNGSGRRCEHVETRQHASPQSRNTEGGVRPQWRSERSEAGTAHSRLQFAVVRTGTLPRGGRLRSEANHAGRCSSVSMCGGGDGESFFFLPSASFSPQTTAVLTGTVQTKSSIHKVPHSARGQGFSIAFFYCPPAQIWAEIGEAVTPHPNTALSCELGGQL